MIIYKGTHGIPLVWTLYQGDGKTPYNLGGKTVYFRLWRQTDPSDLLINSLCTISGDPETGKVEYDIRPGDFEAHGEYWAQFVAIEDSVDTVPFTPFLIRVKNVAVPTP